MKIKLSDKALKGVGFNVMINDKSITVYTRADYQAGAIIDVIAKNGYLTEPKASQSIEIVDTKAYVAPTITSAKISDKDLLEIGL